VPLHWYLPNPANPARNLAGAGLGWISKKWSDSRFARAEIQQHPSQLLHQDSPYHTPSHLLTYNSALL